MEYNDVWVRPKNKVLGIAEDVYEYTTGKSPQLSNKRVLTEVLRAPQSVTVWPGEYLEVDVPDHYAGEEVALEPRSDTPLNNSAGQGFDEILWCCNTI